MLRRGCIAAVITVFLAATGFAAAAPTESVVFQFAGTNGNQPAGTLVADAQGNLYGTTPSGGATRSACPPVTKTTPTGGQQIVLPGGCGIVFKLTPPASGTGSWKESIIADFSGSNGSSVERTLVFDKAGNLYGVTDTGGNGDACPGNLAMGTLPGCGVVFELSPPVGAATAWTLTVLHRFNGNDGATPEGLAFGSDGNLYGVTSRGGNSAKGCPSNAKGVAAGCGTVYQLARPAAGTTAWTEMVLHNFGTGGDGTYPVGILAISGGNLYGTASAGGEAPAGCAGNAAQYIPIGCGAVFELTKPAPGKTAWTEALIYKFSGEPAGAIPYGGVILDKAGNLYGTASAGGTGSTNSSYTVGNGTVFRLSPPASVKTGWTPTILWRFAGGTDGSQPYSGLVIDAAENLYGTTLYGGGQGPGIAYKLTPPASGTGLWTETVLHRFTVGKTLDAIAPLGGLLRMPSGVLYGTAVGSVVLGTNNNPQFGDGAVFEITP
jgi:uncharacterized protein YceK